MTISRLKQTLKTVKDLILFDSVWKKRNKNKKAQKLPKKALERIAKYRDLVKSSTNTVLANVYPNTNLVLKKYWNNLLSEYTEKYPPDSPLLIKVAEHFPQFLSTKKDLIKKYPFLAELAMYEWTEVDIYEREVLKPMVAGKINPIHELCKFKYPIPIIIENIRNNKNSISIKELPITVFIYRDPEEFYTRFVELSSGTEHYINLIKNGSNHAQAVKKLIAMYKIDKKNTKSFIKDLKALELQLKKNRILL